jgi:hypothetical protein
LLGLRRTRDGLSVGTGEDGTLARDTGEVVHRQVKKKEGGEWSFTALSDFIGQAWARFYGSERVRHEFYTNAGISSQVRGKGGYLSPDHPKVAKLAGGRAEEFCKTVRFHQNHLQPDPTLLLRYLKGEVEQVIERDFPGVWASDLVRPNELTDLVARLVEAEFGLTPGQEVTWDDIERAVKLDHLMSALPPRALGEGSLTPLQEYIADPERLDDDAQAVALGAAAAGRNITRHGIDDGVLDSIDEWLAHPGADYRITVLEGAPGSGKTWTLMRLGVKLATRPDVRVLLAADRPLGTLFSFRHLALHGQQPTVVLVDSLFPEWVQHMRLPVSLPLLFLATADSAFDREDLQELRTRRATRIAVIHLAPGPNKTELNDLAAARGVELASGERRLAEKTNFRHASHLLSGTEPAEHLSRLQELAQRPELLKFLEPIWLCSSARVRLPLALLERFVGRGLPAELEPWTLGLRSGYATFEDAGEAEELLQRLYASQLEQRPRAVYPDLLAHLNAEEELERAFARLLFRQLARRDPGFARELAISAGEEFAKAIVTEPQWAIILSWLPALCTVGARELTKVAIEKVASDPPHGVGVHLLWLAAYDVEKARQLLREAVQSINWDTKAVLELLETVIRFRDKDLKQDSGRQLTSWFLDLPRPIALELLRRRNAFQQLAALGARYGAAEDRRALLVRFGEFFETVVQWERGAIQRWLEPYLSLWNRVLMQRRSGVALELTRRVILEGQLDYPYEVYYRDLFESERMLSHGAVVQPGILRLRELTSEEPTSVPVWAGSLLDFVGAWGGDEEWEETAAAVLSIVETLGHKPVSIDRVSALVLPLFGAVRRGPRHVCERFLRAAIAWLPSADTSPSVKTAQLVINLFGFAARQPWLPDEVQSLAKSALLAFVTQDDHDPAAPQAVKHLRRTFDMRSIVVHPSVGLPPDWVDESSVATTYLSQVWRLDLTSREREKTVALLIAGWGSKPPMLQPLTEAVLRLGHEDEAGALARELAETAEYPDCYAYLAMCCLRKDKLDEAREWLQKVLEFREERGRGLHQHVTSWMHTEFANRCRGRARRLHLLCAELARHRLLRRYEEVVEA